jgi:hypothetical protein
MAAVAGEPIAINASAGAPAYSAAEWRRAMAALISPNGAAGVTPFGGSAGPVVGFGAGLVALAGSTITVKAHCGVISPDLSITQGAYLYQLPADSTFTLTAAHATLVRNDLVTLRVDDNDEDASGARQVIPDYVVGTPGAGVPALPARSIELARINVPQSGGGGAVLTERNRWTGAAGGIIPVRDGTDRDDSTQLTPYAGRLVYRLDTNRFEYRGASVWRALEVVIACTSGTRPTGQEGLHIYETDTDRALVYHSGAWTLPGNRAGGLVDVPKVRTTTIGPFTSQVDASGLSISWVAAAGRWYHALFTARTAATDAVGSVRARITDAANNPVAAGDVHCSSASVGGAPMVASAYVSGLSGSTTLKVRVEVLSGGGNGTIPAGATDPATFTVEDVGGA